MTDSPRSHHHPESAPPPPHPPAADAPDVVLQVHLRPATVARLRAFAAREGAPVEALAALWLEEKLAEAAQHGSGAGGGEE